MKTKNLTLMEAVSAMKEGKKIRRPYFKEGFYWYKSGSIVRNSNGTSPTLELWEWYEATDWEIIEEKMSESNDPEHTSGETLSELITPNAYPTLPFAEVEQINKDVKEALKEFISVVNSQLEGTHNKGIKNEAKRIFGDGLI